MDVADLIRYKSAQLLSFGLSKAPNSELYCLAGQTKAYISELFYSHHNDERICTEQSSLSDLSKFKPSHGIPRNAPNIFNQASKEEKHRLLIDYHLMSQEMRIANDRVTLSQIQWSPVINNLAGDYYLAYLTNFGGCEIRAKNVPQRTWSIIQHKISKHWMLNCQKSIKYVINTFDVFESAVNEVKITAISWNNVNDANGKPLLSMITANGNFVVYEIGTDLNIRFQKQTDRKNVQSMQWFTFTDNLNQRRSFVITSEISGVVSLLSVQLDEQSNEISDVNAKLCLFDEADDVFANGIQSEYLMELNRLLVVFCKGMHIFASLIDLNSNENPSMILVNQYIGHMAINGITRTKPLEYVVGTMTGHLETIQFNIDTNGTSMQVRSEVVKPPNGQTKYGIHGLAASRNAAFLLIAYYARRPFDHLVLREPAHIAVGHYIDGLDALHILQKNKTGNISTQHDLAALVQNVQIRNDAIFQAYLGKYPTEMDITDAYIHQIKIRLIVTSARCTFLKSKNRLIESGNLFAEYGFLTRMVLAIRSYRILKHLSRKTRTLGEFQKLAIVCCRTELRDFLSLSIFDEYDAIKLPFHSQIEDILTKTDDYVQLVEEFCVYCDKIIDQKTRVCSDNHNFPRCCISLIQLPLMQQQRQCTKCEMFALDDRDRLNEILPIDLRINEIICPMCDSTMQTPQSIYSTS